jgi:very-short-patch-repair endonuclease
MKKTEPQSTGQRNSEWRNKDLEERGNEALQTVAIPLRNEKGQWNKGHIVTEEMRIRISEAVKEHLAEHPEIKTKISQALKGRVGSRKGKKATETTRQRISMSLKTYFRGHPDKKRGFETGHPSWNKGKTFSVEVRQRISEGHKGQKPWNKGKTGIYTEETLRKISNSRKGKVVGKENPFFGKRHTEQMKKHLSEVHKGRPTWMKGKHWSEEHKKRHSEIMKGRPSPMKGKRASQETKRKQSESKKRYFAHHPEAREYLAEQLIKNSHIRPNKAETFLSSFLDNLYPDQWKYVGDGQLIINGKCPDYANVNGQKKLIELFGDYWHSEKRKLHSKEQEERQRTEYFAKYGYSTLIVWEHELRQPETLKQKILTFVGGN